MMEIDIKLLLLGDPYVGKTSFLRKYAGNGFKNKYELTIGVDYSLKRMEINNRKIKIHMWDTAGQESFRAITMSYFRSADCALIFFDVDNIDSYNNIEYWVNTYIEVSGNSKDSIILLANKTDSILRDISPEDTRCIARELNIQVIEISVKNDDIEDIVKQLVKRTILNKNIKENKNIKINKNIKVSSSCGVCN